MRSLWRIVRALVMALRGHRRQKDKAGKPYWHHLVTVALIAYGLTHEAEAVVVGLLHDYAEDVSKGDLLVISDRFGYTTGTRCLVLTHLLEESYEQYLDVIMSDDDRIVHAVKLADLLHNTEPGRIHAHDADSLKRSLRYARAMERLVVRRVEESRL